MQANPSIFKAYDIRGIVPSTIHEEVAEALGKAFGTAALREGETTVAVGRDGRLSAGHHSCAIVRSFVSSMLIATLAMIRPTTVQPQIRPFRLIPGWKYASPSGPYHVYKAWAGFIRSDKLRSPVYSMIYITLLGRI